MRKQRFAGLIALVLAMAACSPGPGTGGQLEGTEWVLRSYEQDGTLTLVPETLYADVEFAASRVRGFAGCNDYQAVYRAGGRTLLVSQASSTLMACPEDAMAFEQAYLGLLDASRFYTARRGSLTVYDAEGTTILVFDAAPRNPLRGNWAVVSYRSAESSVSSPLAGTSLDVVFGIASVGGFSGCNSFSGTYGTNGNVVRIGRLATTQMPCEQAVTDQETAFLEALQGAALIDVRGQGLNLTDLSGSLVVALVRPSLIPEASAVPSPGASPKASAIPSEQPSPAPSATPKPTLAPTPTPTTPATPAPTPEGSAAPTAPPAITPPIALPTLAVCDLLAAADGALVARITYPGTWFTVPEPPELACRYFDPASITVPADPATLQTAVMASHADTAYVDAVAEATDPASWDVSQKVELVIRGRPATLVEATATTETDGVDAGSTRFAYLVDVGEAGTVTLFTTATTRDDAYVLRAGTVTLMTALSVFAGPS